MRRGGHAGHTTILLREHLFDLITFKLTQANLNKSTDNSTAHFVKEPIAFDYKREQRTAALYVTTGQPPYRVFQIVPAIGGKRTEIVFADEQFRANPHGSQIQLPCHLPRLMAQ